MAVQLAPLLAAEKSKTAFYIVGGLLVVWAFVLALGIGMRRPNFPANQAAERGVIAISVTLVAGTLAAAVLTSGPPAKSEAATAAPASTTHTSAPATPAAATTNLALSVPGTQYAYNTKQLTARAGTVSITMTNMSPIEHDVTVEQGGTLLGATPKFTGGSKVLTLNLKAGTYKFYCSVPGHRQLGMEGTLTVK